MQQCILGCSKNSSIFFSPQGIIVVACLKMGLPCPFSAVLNRYRWYILCSYLFSSYLCLSQNFVLLLRFLFIMSVFSRAFSYMKPYFAQILLFISGLFMLVLASIRVLFLMGFLVALWPPLLNRLQENSQNHFYK